MLEVQQGLERGARPDLTGGGLWETDCKGWPLGACVPHVWSEESKEAVEGGRLSEAQEMGMESGWGRVKWAKASRLGLKPRTIQ